MDDAKQLSAAWQSLLSSYREVFTSPGWVRFAQWLTGLVLCDEEHTITQTVYSLGIEQQWRNWEHFAEYGAFDVAQVQTQTMALVEKESPARWGGYHPVAVDDTKELRWGPQVWGVCTYKHISRNPRHPKLVRGHNWVVAGDLLPGGPRQPWTYLPTTSRLYLRQCQLPPGEVFATKGQLALQILRQADAVSAAPLLAVTDGGYAGTPFVQACLLQDRSAAHRRIDVLTRPRCDARLYAAVGRQPATGRKRKWGQRLPSPRDHGRWNIPWRPGRAWIYGRQRHFRCKQLSCYWTVSGPQTPVHVFVFEVEGYSKPWYLVTTARDLSAAQVVEAYAARFRQEDAIRDHKQRLGMEEVRAWTKNPVLRTFCMQQVALTLLRLWQRRLAPRGGHAWFTPPPWNPRKNRVSLLDLRRLAWRNRTAFLQLVTEPHEMRKPTRAVA